MDIQVGDKITGKWLDNSQEMTEIVTKSEIINFIKENIKNKNIEILKIERPKYEVMEEKKELLDEKEKEYLKYIIKPFKNKVLWIAKENDVQKGDYIEIDLKDEAGIMFPYFKKDTMYKGLKSYKHYTLKELGLEE